MSAHLRTHGDYQIGILCALAIEKAAVEAMLDEEHPRLKKKEYDVNKYTLGRIGAHNIVIACLPAGLLGNGPAAIVAKDMMRSFPIKLGLMVGIGGGVWSNKADIRLGDVVVSQPEGTHGGVVQWDFGKMEKGGVFRRTGALDKPPPGLLHALQSMKTKHFKKGNMLPESLLMMSRTNPFMAETFKYQGEERDQLFKADYNHEGDETCDKCDIRNVVERKPRTNTDPQIHYGNIASGNEVMKCGVTRDKIAKDEGVICFEMEAAGLMDNFPCLVVRGICDYADSHKNKAWQPYAAAVAAALAKELLSFVDEQEALGAVYQYNNQTSKLLCSELPLATDTFCGRATELLALKEALDPTKPGQKGIVLCGIGGSGKTQLALRYIEQYQQLYTAILWIDASTIENTKQSLTEAANLISSNWPRDLPLAYAGSSDWRKLVTRLRSTCHTCWLLVIDSVDDLDQQNFRQYIPSCHYGSIIVTSTQNQASDVFRLSKLEVDRLDLDSSRGLLLMRASSFIGGSDISPDDSKNATAIVKELHGLPLAIEQAGALLGRGIVSFSNFITDYRTHYCVLMDKYPSRGLLSYDKERSIMTCFSMLYSFIKKRNPEAAALLAFIAIIGPWQVPISLMKQFYLNETEDCKPLDKDTKALRRVLSDHIVLNMSFDLLADVCLVKLKRNRSLFCESFSLHRAICQWCVEVIATEKQDWMIHAAHGLAAGIFHSSKIYTSSWKFENQSVVRSYLAPLNRCMSLIQKHVSSEDLSPPDGRFCAPYADIASQLAQAYLCEGRSEEAKTYFYTAIAFETIKQGVAWPSTEASLDLLYGLAVACQKSGDLENAVEILGSALTLSQRLFGMMDAKSAAISSRLKAVSERQEVMLEHHKSMVISTTNSKSCREAQQMSQVYAQEDSHENLGVFRNPEDEAEIGNELEEERGTDYNAQLHGASYEGDEGIVKLLLGLGNVQVDSKGIKNRTSLSWAAERGHEAVVELLLEKGAQAETEDSDGQTPLLYAAENGHEAVVKLLLEKGAQAETKDSYGQTPLLYAAENGHEAVVKLLLEKGAQAETKDSSGQTPLLYAAANGHEAVVKLLLEKGAQAETKDSDGQTPLLYAAENGHEAVVKLLLEKGAQLETEDSYDQTPLSYAVRNGHEVVVKLLLEKGAQLETEDSYGQTPLSYAAENGHEAVVKLLLEKGAQAETKDIYGRMPLSYAVRNGHKVIEKLLLEKGTQLETIPSYVRTPLL